MGKRIIPRRRGRGHRYKAPDNRFKGEARHPRAKYSTGKSTEPWPIPKGILSMILGSIAVYGILLGVGQLIYNDSKYNYSLTYKKDHLIYQIVLHFSWYLKF